MEIVTALYFLRAQAHGCSRIKERDNAHARLAGKQSDQKMDFSFLIKAFPEFLAVY